MLKQTCLIIIPKAAINPEVMVQAWSTLLLEGMEMESGGVESTLFPLLVLPSLEGYISARPLMSSRKVSLVCKVKLLLGCPSLLDFFIGLRLAKALTLNLVLCRWKHICIKLVEPEGKLLSNSETLDGLQWLSFGVKVLCFHSI